MQRPQISHADALAFGSVLLAQSECPLTVWCHYLVNRKDRTRCLGQGTRTISEVCENTLSLLIAGLEGKAS